MAIVVVNLLTVLVSMESVEIKEEPEDEDFDDISEQQYNQFQETQINQKITAVNCQFDQQIKEEPLDLRNKSKRRQSDQHEKEIEQLNEECDCSDNSNIEQELDTQVNIYILRFIIKIVIFCCTYLCLIINNIVYRLLNMKIL